MSGAVNKLERPIYSFVAVNVFLRKEFLWQDGGGEAWGGRRQ